MLPYQRTRSRWVLVVMTVSVWLGIAGVAPSGAPVVSAAPPDTTVGIHRGVVFLHCTQEFGYWAGASAACNSAVANHTLPFLQNKLATGWTAYNAPVVNLINPALGSKLGVALQFDRSPGYPFDYSMFSAAQWTQGFAARPFNWWLSNHPDWIMYNCSGGVTWEFGDVPSDYHSAAAYVPLDVANPAVRDFYWNTYVRPAIDHGAPLIFFDNLALYNAWAKCGHYTTSGQWVQQYSGIYQDSAYQNDIISWMSWIYNRIKSYSPNVIVAYNYDPAESNDDPVVRDRVLDYLDMWFHEAGFNYWGLFKALDGLWLRIKDTIDSAQRKGKLIYHSETAMVTDPANQISHDDKNWGLANYLLFKGNQHFISYSGSTCTGCTYNFNDYGYYVDMPEYNINLGAPTGALFQSQGVWMRNYQNGLVIVNPGNAAYNLNLGRSYVDMWNAPVGPSFFMNGQSAIVLLGSGGVATPTPTPTPTGTPPVGTPSGRIAVVPAAGSYAVGSSFTAYVVLSAAQPFMSAAATVAVSSNLQIENLSAPPAAFGPCNFSAYTVTPTAANPSFAGGYNAGLSASSCTLYALTVRVTAGGTGTITFTNGSIVSATNQQIFQAVENGTYTLTGGTATPTPTPTATPTPTPTSTPTATPTATPTGTPPRGTPSGRLSIAPSTGTVAAGNQFTAYLVVTAGQSFSAAAATVSVSPNLQVLSVDAPPAAYGPCNFQSYSVTPTAANPSFAAAYAPGYASSSCTLYGLTVRALSAGTGTITVSNGSVLSSTGLEIFQSVTNGSYTVTGGSTPTPTPTATPSPTATPTVTPTPTPSPTATPTPPPANRTGTMLMYPSSGAYSVGQTFDVSLYAFGNGTAFSSAAASVSVSRNLRVVSVSPGTCNFTFTVTPTAADPSFAGSAPGNLDSCVVYYVRVQALSAGPAVLGLSSGSMKTAAGSEILYSQTSGSYTIQ